MENVLRSERLVVADQSDAQPRSRFGGWSALSVCGLWIIAFGVAIAVSTVFPNFSDQFIPAKINANALAASLVWLTQIALGTAGVALALPISDYLSTSQNMLGRVALVAGIAGGMFLIAAGAGGQENVFVSTLYTSDQASQLANALQVPDLTVINVANDLVAGGLRSTAAYATGWAMLLWSIAAFKTRRLPIVLNGIGMVTGILYALTVWIGPIVGLFSFIGMLVWHLWLGLFLLRSK